MQILRKNTKEITREEAFQAINHLPPINIKELNNFSRRFGGKAKPKDLIIARQVGLGDSTISRIGRKYFISDCLIKY